MKRYIHPENQPLGLDEIMIVNPAPEQTGMTEQDTALFLGEDGTLYGLFGPQDPLREGDLLLGQDGSFYRVAVQSHLGDSIFLG